MYNETNHQSDVDYTQSAFVVPSRNWTLKTVEYGIYGVMYILKLQFGKSTSKRAYKTQTTIRCMHTQCSSVEQNKTRSDAEQSSDNFSFKWIKFSDELHR